MLATLFFDFDSTLCRLESLDQALLTALKSRSDKPRADKASLEKQINAISHAAMAGEIDLCESILARLALLSLNKTDIATTANQLAAALTPGIADLIADLRQAGHQVHIVSGGFDDFIAPSARLLGLPKSHIHANQFIFTEGEVTGINTANPLTRSGGKAAVIAAVMAAAAIALGKGKPQQTTVMVGDGYNDLAVYLQNGCDHFIGLGVNVRRAIIAQQAPLYANSVAELAVLLNTLRESAAAKNIAKNAADKLI